MFATLRAGASFLREGLTSSIGKGNISLSLPRSKIRVNYRIFSSAIHQRTQQVRTTQKVSSTLPQASSTRKTVNYMGYFFATIGTLAVGQALKKTILCADEEPTIIKEPISEGAFKSFERVFLDEEKCRKVIGQIRQRGAVLDVRGFSLKELSFLANWLEHHYHGLLRLTGMDAFPQNTAIQDALGRIQKEVIRNRAQFRDRASPRECAEFASLAYKDLSAIERSLSRDWSVMQYEDDPKSGYTGVAFVNHSLGQVVIAHCGTKFPQVDKMKRAPIKAFARFLQDLETDFNEVVKQQPGAQQQCALEFAAKVGALSKKWGYTVGIVGHSLGGWLAKLSSHGLYEKSIPTYVVCIDPPGTMKMFEEFYRIRYGDSIPRNGDFTTYCWLPNLVNTCGTHEGTLYQLTSDRLTFENAHQRSWQGYLGHTHSIENLLVAFPEDIEETPRSVRILEWPRIEWGKPLESLGVREDHLVTEALMGIFYQVIASPLYTINQFRISNLEYRMFFDRAIWERMEQLSKQGLTPSFDLRYRAHYRIEPVDEKTLPLIHIPSDMRSFLRYMDEINRQASPEAVEAFLKDAASTSHLNVSEDELSLLRYVRIQGDDLVITGNQFQKASQFRREYVKLFRSCPELTEKVNFQNYLIFLVRKFPYLPASTRERFWNFPVPPLVIVQNYNALKGIANLFESSNIVILRGPTGVGKSELARQYGVSEKNGKRRPLVAYFDGSDLDQLKTKLIEFALQSLHISYNIDEEPPSFEEVIASIQQALQEHHHYLLVFDGVNQTEGIQALLSKFSGNGGDILITTTQNLKLPEARTLLVSSEDCATELFIQTIHHLDESVDLSDLPQLPEVLKSSIFITKLAAHYFVKNRQGFIALLSEYQESPHLAEVLVECVRKEATGVEGVEMLLNTLALLGSNKLSRELVEKWLSYKGVSSPEVVVETLIGYGFLESVDEEKEVFICPVVSQKGEGSDASQNLLFLDFLQFLNENLQMDNIYLEDFEENRLVRIHVEGLFHRINTQEYVQADHERLHMMALLNASGNNCLRREAFLGACGTFEKAKKLGEQIVGFSFDENLNLRTFVDEVEKSLEFLDEGLKRKWLTQYARSLHYLGKIYFQTERKSKGEAYLKAAFALRDEFLDLECEEERIDFLIFRRQGIGWILLDSSEKGPLLESKRLYADLYDEDDHPINHSICSRQYAKACCKLASIEKRAEVKKHYYTKALQRLRDGGHRKGIPFRGALAELRDDTKSKKDEDGKVYFAIGQILADPENPLRDFDQAEMMFRNVLKLVVDVDAPDNCANKETLIATYYELAKLYLLRMCSSTLVEDLYRVENEKNQAKARACALKGFEILRKTEYSETFLVLNKKLEKALKGLDEILRSTA